MAEHQTIAQAVLGAASAPYVKTAMGGAGLAGIGEWLMTGPGLATFTGVCIAAASFLLQLWLGAREDRRKQERPGLVGEVYELTNVSGQRMVVDERELYRPGVVSVSLRALQLAPGASTAVWIVRQADDRD